MSIALLKTSLTYLQVPRSRLQHVIIHNDEYITLRILEMDLRNESLLLILIQKLFLDPV